MGRTAGTGEGGRATRDNPPFAEDAKDGASVSVAGDNPIGDNPPFAKGAKDGAPGRRFREFGEGLEV
jgi:hypothetical protein